MPALLVDDDVHGAPIKQYSRNNSISPDL